MRKSITTLDIVITIYFFIAANLLFWFSLLGIIIVLYQILSGHELVATPWLLVINLSLGLFRAYGAIIFFRKERKKYTYALMLIPFVWVVGQANRFFFIYNRQLDPDFWGNLLLDGIPFAIVLLARYLDRKYIN